MKTVRITLDDGTYIDIPEGSPWANLVWLTFGRDIRQVRRTHPGSGLSFRASTKVANSPHGEE